MSELSMPEESALVEHLLREPDAASKLEQYIHAGGTLAGYVEEWKQKRDEAAQAVEITPETARRVLGLPVGERWTDGATVRDYLVELLEQFWRGRADAKYGMDGSSDWQYDLYYPLSAAGLIPGWKDGYGVGYRADGSNHSEDRKRANDLIAAAIRELNS